MADTDSSEGVLIHSLADVPVLSYAESGGLKSIYTFLGLASVPRLRPGNPLRLLPREIVVKIARLAHGYRAGWAGVGSSGELAASVDVSDYPDITDSLALKMHPIRSGVQYVEITLTIAWFGTRIFFESPDDSRPELFGVELTCWEDAPAEEEEEQDTDKAVDVFYVGGRPGARQVDMQRLRDFADNWTWCHDPVIFGCLVDTVQGCVTFGLNGVTGPCVRFPDFPWQSGVRIGLDYLPDCGGDSSYPRCIASCATPPTPPRMLVEANHPMTAAGHLARVGPNRPLSQISDMSVRLHDFFTIHGGE